MYSLAKIAYLNCNDLQRDKYDILETPRINLDVCCIGIFKHMKNGHLLMDMEDDEFINQTINEQKKRTAIEFAAALGDLTCLKMAIRLGFPRTANICLEAATHGNLDCLRYAHENGCRWNALVCEKAAAGGHLDCLRYAHENGCPWDEKVCASAVTNGQLECLKYATEQGCPLDLATGGESASTENRNARFVHRDGHGFSFLVTYCELALRTGNETILRYLLENGYRTDDSLCWKAAFFGNLECLKVLREFKCSWNEMTCTMAAMKGHLDCLRYAHRNGCPWNTKTTELAALHGQLDCLAYARLNGCPRASGSIHGTRIIPMRNPYMD